MVHEPVDSRYDVIIVGGGPAGLSGALVLGRCRRRVLVCDDHRPRNARSHAMHAFLTRDGTSPSEFLRVARAELEHYPSVTWHAGEVVAVDRQPFGFRVRTREERVFEGAKLLIATGLVDELPPIAGFAERWGTSVFPCPFCDGWEFRDQPLAVLGCDASGGCGFALEMLTWSSSLTLLLHGGPAPGDPAREQLQRLGIEIEPRPIAALEGPSPELEYIRFADGERRPFRAVFMLTSQHQRTRFADVLGLPLTADKAVPTDGLQHTRTRGVYAAGNASVGLQAAILAAAEGFKAAYAINDELVEDMIAARLGAKATVNPEV